MSARVEPGGGRPGAREARREARGFAEHLAAARRADARQAGAAAARRAAAAGDVVAEAGASPGAALSRRRSESDGLDWALHLRRRGLDGAEEAASERRAEAPPGGAAAGGAAAGGAAREAAAPGAAPPRAADLAAAAERLAAAVERRDRALGPELRLDLGGAVSVRLAAGEKGVEVVIAGEAGMARLLRAGLPEVVARLRERGVEVARAEVRAEPAPARPGALTGGEASATSGLRHGTVAKW